jgi:predicted DNA-binding transcriptional regulator AlpA
LSPSRADDLIGVEYVATRVGLSARTILAGKAGTKELLKKRIQKHPSRWKRADVDAFITDLVKAKEALRRNNFSLVRRRKRRK